jgi:PIN domain nuclease of toxin-antitoxin system
MLNQRDEIDNQIISILDDYSNSFYVNSVVIKELILLYKSGEIKRQQYKTYKDMFYTIEELNYEILPVTKKHLFAYAELVPATDHKDPNDHLIIAQSISDKIPIISSDRKFKLYENQGLQLVYNKR